MPTTKPTPAWRVILPIHAAANKIPEATTEERRALSGNLRADGLKVPIVLVRVGDGDPQLLDGRHRLDLLEETGTKVVDEGGKVLVRHEIVSVADDAEAERLSLSLNAHRRHLTAEQRRSLIAAVLKANPEKSDRHIGEMFKADHKTVGAVRAQQEATGEISPVEKRVGGDGKRRGKRASKTNATPPAVGEKSATKSLTVDQQIAHHVRVQRMKDAGEIEHLTAENRRLSEELKAAHQSNQKPKAANDTVSRIAEIASEIISLDASCSCEFENKVPSNLLPLMGQASAAWAELKKRLAARVEINNALPTADRRR
jgi:hypothetical protein